MFPKNPNDDLMAVEKIPAHRRNSQTGMVYKLHISDKTSLWSPENLAKIDCAELLDDYKKQHELGFHKGAVTKQIKPTSTNNKKITKTVPKLRNKCKVNHKHFDPINLVAEIMSFYFKENCRFYNSICSKCRTKNLPNVSKPIFMCIYRTIG